MDSNILNNYFVNKQAKPNHYQRSPRVETTANDSRSCQKPNGHVTVKFPYKAHGTAPEHYWFLTIQQEKMFRLALAAVLLTGVLCIYDLQPTATTHPFTRDCNPGDILKRLVSVYDHNANDRIWTYGCENSPFPLAQTGRLTGNG